MAGGGDEDDLSALAWPGFVDILSSVVIMFVFFVLIIAVALYFHTIIFKAKVLVEMSEKINVDVGEETDTLTKTIKTLEKKIEIAEEEKQVLERVISEYEEQFYQARAEFTESKEQKFTQNEEENELIIFFGRDAISLTKESQEQIKAIAKAYQDKLGAADIKIRLEGSRNPSFAIQNSARQIAVARMFNVRNVFLEMEISSDNIAPTLVEGTEIQDSYDWVRIKFEK